MSNPEKMKVDEKEKEDSSDEQWSGEESAMREIVLGLPALKISSEVFGVSSTVDEEERALLNEQAVVAAELVIAAAEEAVMKEKSDGKKKKKVSRQRKTMKLNDDEAGGSSVKGGEAKKPRKKSTSEFTNLPRGPPVCNVCGKAFGSWKAVFGHLRSHKDRNYRGFLPPPTFTAPPTRGVMIPGPNSAFVRVVARGGSSSGVVSAGGVVASGGGGGATGGEGGQGVGIDLNVDRLEEGNQEGNESGTVAKFDLNKSPPKEDEEEDKTK